MIKDNGFETSGNGELEEELLDALHKKGLVPDGESAQEEEAAAEEAIAAEEASAAGEAEEAAPAEEEPAADAAEDEAAAEEAEAEKAGKKKKAKKEKTKRFNSRRLRYGSMATGVTAAVVVLVVILNVVVGILSDRYPLNLDLTQDKMFTLTENSVEIAQSIDKEVQVLVFADEQYFESPNAQLGEVGDLFRELYTALQQYGSHSGGNVTVQYIDLNANPTLATTYEEYEPIDFDVVFVCGDRFKKVNVLNDMAESSQDQYTGSYSLTSKVELTIASQMRNVTNDNPNVVAVFTGHSELDGAVDTLRDLYEVNGYEFQEVNLATNTEIDENATVGLIAAPANDFTQAEVEKLQKWLNNDGKLGRNLMVFINPNGNCPELYNFLNVEYGIEVTNRIVYETDSGRILGVGTSLADLADTDFTTDISGERAVAAVNAVQLITHFENDTSLSTYNVDIMTFPETAELIVPAEEGQTEIKTEPADEYPIVGMAAAVRYTYVDNEPVETNVVVNGSIYMLNYLQYPNWSNEDLLLNTMNTITGAEDTINVSTKSLDAEMLQFTQLTAWVVGLGVFTIGIPVLILVIGLVVFLRRRHL